MTNRATALLTIATLLVAGGCGVLGDDDDGQTTISRVTYVGRTTGAAEGAIVITVDEHDSAATSPVGASGVLMPDGDDPIDVAGGYDRSTRMVMVAAGGY